MKNLRSWATPLATGVFLIVAATGITMFFKASSPLGHVLHEWLGWVLVASALLHIVANWTALKGHLGRTLGRAIVGVSLVVLVASVVPVQRGGSPEDSMRGAVSALSRASLKELAPLAGRDAESILSDLRQAGFPDATMDSSCESLSGSDRGKRFKAIAAIFPSRRQSH
jgi:hypothetical protein